MLTLYYDACSRRRLAVCSLAWPLQTFSQESKGLKGVPKEDVSSLIEPRRAARNLSAALAQLTRLHCARSPATMDQFKGTTDAAKGNRRFASACPARARVRARTLNNTQERGAPHARRGASVCSAHARRSASILRGWRACLDGPPRGQAFVEAPRCAF
jgi:hypothetical protein